jgi:hypothetical protein
MMRSTRPHSGRTPICSVWSIFKISHCVVRSSAKVMLAALTPLLEKNVLKTLPLNLAVVFSMSRVIVLAFAVAVLRQIWRSGISGWPDATLAIAVVLALPLLGALERVKSSDVVELAKTLVGRLGSPASRL